MLVFFAARGGSADPTSLKLESTQGTQAVPTGMLVYQPPGRSATRSRIGGGTQAAAGGMLRELVLAPDHTGLTREEQPTLYWYIPQATTHPIEFTSRPTESPCATG
jgi:hypothetical protein